MNFNFSQTINLENDPVHMRPLELNDFNFLLPFSENEPDLWFYSLTPANGSHNLKKYIQSALLAKENNKAYPFIIFDKRTHNQQGVQGFMKLMSNIIPLVLDILGTEKNFNEQD